MHGKRNVIVLTSGLAGSSVLTALVARAGYWTGDSTFKKSDYDTWENHELVQLNKKILEDVGFSEDWTKRFDKNFVPAVSSNFDALDDEPYIDFVKKCSEHSPWIWKDPRLWLTIRYWARLVDLSNTVFLLIRREPLQAWISTLIRRQIQTYSYGRNLRDGIYGTIVDFVQQNDLTYLEITYEDLMRRPETAVAEINKYLKTDLSSDDFLSVFRGKPYRRQHGVIDLLKALAILLRNFSQRYR